eukprot:scaffold59674_cov63-Phaeocystis_antarctica.AAC.4
MLQSQPAHARPHLRPEHTLHGIVDGGALERLGGSIEKGQHPDKDRSAHIGTRAQLRGHFLAECSHK